VAGTGSVGGGGGDGAWLALRRGDGVVRKVAGALLRDEHALSEGNGQNLQLTNDLTLLGLSDHDLGKIEVPWQANHGYVHGHGLKRL